MSNKNSTINRAYWEKNIAGFSGFYDRTSEENILAPAPLAKLYKKFVFPIEKRFMYDRYVMVSRYIEDNVTAGMTVADVGCGSGIFVKQMAERGAKVYAIDYASAALTLARETLSGPEMASVEFLEMDITDAHIPPVDLVISIGVLTYIDDLATYLDHILPYTTKIMFNYLVAGNPLNVVRRIVPLLDVRRLSYHSPGDVRENLRKRGFRIDAVRTLATGHVVEAVRVG